MYTVDRFTTPSSVPELDDPWLHQRFSAHYAYAICCRATHHGAGGGRIRPKMPLAMQTATAPRHRSPLLRYFRFIVYRINEGPQHAIRSDPDRKPI
jgi:hypothetical protein